jgi:hypothetical protein
VSSSRSVFQYDLLLDLLLDLFVFSCVCVAGLLVPETLALDVAAIGDMLFRGTRLSGWFHILKICLLSLLTNTKVSRLLSGEELRALAAALCRSARLSRQA